MAKILIVDDAPENIQLIAQLLKSDYQLMVAKNGLQALDIINSGTLPDLVLLDIEMPELDGYQVCKQLKSNAQTQSIPIIFLTSKTQEQEEEYGLSLGAVDYIGKPVQPAILKARVKNQITIKLQRDELKRMAIFDHLTGLYNRHYLFDVGERRVAKAIRHQQPFSILLIDIDYFKAVNDNYGHLVGDRVLEELAKLLKTSFRKEDIIARLGGEEFLILMDCCSLDKAQQVAKSLCFDVQNQKFDGLNITVSVGAASLQSLDKNFQSLLLRADNALYKAKENGRNQVQI
ncbi:diguanylate cyclase [Paraferrimonas sp. SM1919]|uniref:diguanylate cyclase n=1 Tax=Paraferrimonas sp. SM1919 TaxID=2662263 RepID=UPI0013CFDB13|nr:diguanylate cyclase [Paraferrimonas sp. SM1919]